MDTESYRNMLEAARHDLEAAMEKREEIDKTISSLKQTIIALSRLCSNYKEWTERVGVDISSIESFGITDQCREAIRTSNKDMTPVEVRDQLVRMGLNPDKYTNLMASVHRILKRLLENQEIVKITRQDGETAYLQKPLRAHRRIRIRRTAALPVTTEDK